jgi:LysR family hca operon transcriptional activator
MELRHLRYFAAVAAHGSFNRAAQILHLTQPALSRQVRDLEEEIGTPLLVRGTNTITLTPSGEAFYEDARDLIARADQAIQRARGERGHEVVRVGYVSASVPGIIPAALEKFEAAQPRVRIELADLKPVEMKARAAQGRLDLMVLPDREADRIPGFRWTELRRTQSTLVMAADHPLAKLKRIAPARLRNLPLVGLGRENFPGYTPLVRELLRPFAVTPRFVLLINDGLASLYNELEAHHCAAILSDVVEPTMPRSLVSRPFQPALPDTTIMVGVPEDRPNQHAEEFLHILQEETHRMRVHRGG